MFRQKINKIKSRKSQTGFTLLEILLVIGIIAILAGIVIVAINPGRQLATVRNTERRSDIKQVYNALNQYYIDHSHYVSGLSTTAKEICDSGMASSSSNCTDLLDLTALVPTYLVAIPTDPRGGVQTNGSGYKMALDSSGKLYINAIQAELDTVIEIGKSSGVVGLSWSGTPRYWIATTTSNWNDTTKWSATSGGAGGASVPSSSNDAIFDSHGNGNCTLNSAVDVKGLFIEGYTGTITQTTYAFTVGTDGYEQSSGTLTHAANGTTAQGEMYKVNMTIAGNFTVDSGGTINVDGKGYAASNGPGRSTNGAGSYGGLGKLGGPTYGSIMAPTNLGSGAAQDSGGGAIILSVTGMTTVNGIFSALGQGRTNVYHNGSGGSIFLTTGSISGTGTIKANGATPPYGYGGGGGRVAVILTSGNDFGDVSITAYGGSSSGHFVYGGAGTVYKQTATQGAGQGTLVIDNNNLATEASVSTSINSNITNIPTGDIILQNKGQMVIETGVTLSPQANTIYLSTSSLLQINSGGSLDLMGGSLLSASSSNILKLNGGSFITSPVFSYTNTNIWLATTSVFNPTTSFTIGSNAIFTSDFPHTFSGDLIVSSGGTITHTINSSTAQGEMYKLNLTILGDLSVQGLINVSGKGYDAGGPGVSLVMGEYGSSYGGIGGINGTLANSGSPYGSITSPTNIGSGTNGYGTLSAGGGAAILNVGGLSDISGEINASGQSSNTYYGIGSGGSVYLTTRTFSGNGTIKANGATGPRVGAGGGRIAVILTGIGADFSNYTGIISAYGGDKNYDGAAGTVYKQTAAQGTGQGILVIDNNNLATAAGIITAISASTTDTTVGTITLQNKGNVTINSGQTLTAQNTGTSLTINANSTLTNNGTLNLGGTYVNNGTLVGYPI